MAAPVLALTKHQVFGSRRRHNPASRRAWDVHRDGCARVEEEAPFSRVKTWFSNHNKVQVIPIAGVVSPIIPILPVLIKLEDYHSVNRATRTHETTYQVEAAEIVVIPNG